MGEFARQVKNGTIHGPHTRKFKREDWEAHAWTEDTDFDDKRLAHAGIFFDDLLTFLRSEMRLSHLPLQPSAVMRLAVGLATWNYCRIAAQVQEKLPTPKPGETPILIQSSLEGLQIPVATGLGRLKRRLSIDRFLDSKCQSRLFHAWRRRIFNDQWVIEVGQLRPIAVFTTY